MILDTTWTDAQLVLAYKDGDKTAWDVLCRRYRGRIHRICYRKGITNPEDVNDLTQEILLHAMQNIYQIRKPDSFYEWVSRIAVGIITKWIQTESKRRSLNYLLCAECTVTDSGEVLNPIHLGPEQRTIAAEYLGIVLGLVDCLCASEREVVLMHFSGMKHKEIAADLGISVNAVTVRLCKGKKNLKVLLESEYPNVYINLVV